MQLDSSEGVPEQVQKIRTDSFISEIEQQEKRVLMTQVPFREQRNLSSRVSLSYRN